MPCGLRLSSRIISSLLARAFGVADLAKGFDVRFDNSATVGCLKE